MLQVGVSVLVHVVYAGARGAGRKKPEGSRPFSLRLSPALSLFGSSPFPAWLLHPVALWFVLLLDSTEGIKEGEEGTLPVLPHLSGSPLELIRLFLA